MNKLLVTAFEKAAEDKHLRELVVANFREAYDSWRASYPDEVADIGFLTFDETLLTFHGIRITASSDPAYTCAMEAEYRILCPGNAKIVYILKFWDNGAVYDDVLYTER